MEITSLQPDQAAQPRILALDFGARRIGLAVTDELGLTAQGLPTLERTNKRKDLEHLRHVIKQYGIGEIVMGLPLRLSGNTGTQSDKVELFAEALRKKFKLPVHLFDERLTSVEANEILRDLQVDTRRNRGAVDQMAAVLILQGFLEARESQARKAPDISI